MVTKELTFKPKGRVYSRYLFLLKILRNNYLMIGMDGSMAENGSDWFCYHATSTSMFPVGFCEINGLELTPPKGMDVH